MEKGHRYSQFWCMIDETKKVCARCGISLTLENTDVHHKDGRRYNNNSDNLELLCKKCHRGLGGRASRHEEPMIFTGFRLPSILLEKLDRRANELRMTPSALVREILSKSV